MRNISDINTLKTAPPHLSIGAQKEFQRRSNAFYSNETKNFGQAEGTPFTCGELKVDLSYDGSGPAAEMIMEGEYTN